MYLTKHLSKTVILASILWSHTAFTLPSTAAGQEEKGLTLPPLSSARDSLDVSVSSRDIQDFSKKWRLAVSVTTIFTGGVGIYSLAGDCKDYSEDKEGAVGMKCVVAALATAVGVGSFVVEGLVARAQLAEVLRANNIAVPGITRKRSDLITDFASDYSQRYRSEVRHLGSLEETAAAKEKREADGEERLLGEVFGATIQGRDIHFADMDDLNNGTHIRIGFGSGTPRKRGQQKRDGQEVFNDQFFSDGGIDMLLNRPSQSDSYNRWDPTNQEQFQGMVDYLQCAIDDLNAKNQPTFLQIEFGGSPNDFDPHALNFQMYNEEGEGTEIAGAFAAFRGDDPSGIDQMNLEGGLQTSAMCDAE